MIYPSPSSSQFRVPKPLAPFPHRHNAFLGEIFLNSCTFSAPFSFLIYFNISKCSSSSLSLFIGISCFTQSPLSSSCYHLWWVLSWIFYIIRYQGEASNQLSDAVKNTWGNYLTMRKVLSGQQSGGLSVGLSNSLFPDMCGRAVTQAETHIREKCNSWPKASKEKITALMTCRTPHPIQTMAASKLPQIGAQEDQRRI